MPVLASLIEKHQGGCQVYRPHPTDESLSTVHMLSKHKQRRNLCFDISISWNVSSCVAETSDYYGYSGPGFDYRRAELCQPSIIRNLDSY